MENPALATPHQSEEPAVRHEALQPLKGRNNATSSKFYLETYMNRRLLHVSAALWNSTEAAEFVDGSAET